MPKKRKPKKTNPHKTYSYDPEDAAQMKRRKDAEKAIKAWNRKHRKKRK